MHETLEYAQFMLKPGVSDDQLRAASQSLNDGFLKQQPGYLRRELVKLDGRIYADLIWWRSHEEASAAMEKAMKSLPARRISGSWISTRTIRTRP